MCTDIQTSAGRLSLVPLGIVGVHTFNGDRALFQSIARVAGKLHHSSHGPSAVAAGQVTVLHKGFVTVACCKGWGEKYIFNGKFFTKLSLPGYLASTGYPWTISEIPHDEQ